MINSQEVKEWIIKYGAELCGIAPVARFKDAPAGFHPRDIFPECKFLLRIFP